MRYVKANHGWHSVFRDYRELVDHLVATITPKLTRSEAWLVVDGLQVCGHIQEANPLGVGEVTVTVTGDEYHRNIYMTIKYTLKKAA